MARKFVNRGKNRSVESITRAAKASSNTFDSYLKGELNFYKPRDGENNIRIMPITWDDVEKWGDNWAILIDVHFSIGANKSAYLCLEKMNGEPCAICQAANESDDEEEKRSLRSTRRALCYLIDRDNEKAGPQIWGMPLSLYREINTRSIDKKTGKAILIDDEVKGYDVTFVKEGQGTRSKYSGVEVARDSSPLTNNDKKMDRWLTYIEENPLPSLLNFYDNDHLEKVLTGQASSKRDEAEDEDEEDTRSRRRRSRDDDEDDKPRRGKHRDDDDDEDDVEEELDVSDDDDEDEDEQPSRKRKALRDDDEDEDYDDDEDEDEEEDDDPPSSRRASRSKSRDDDDEDDDDDTDDEDEDDDDDSSDDDDDDDDDDAPRGKKARDEVSRRARERLEKVKAKRKKR